MATCRKNVPPMLPSGKFILVLLLPVMQYSRSGTMKVLTTQQFGSAIRTRRKQIGVTQKELAMTCGTGLRFIIDLERGKPTCQIGKAFRVLQAVGFDIDAVPRGAHTSEGKRT